VILSRGLTLHDWLNALVYYPVPFYQETYLICLFPAGLDPMQFRNSGSSGGLERAFTTLESHISDSDRFKDVTPYMVTCWNCQVQVVFAPIYDRDVRLRSPIDVLFIDV
jgi:hypothetical protein